MNTNTIKTTFAALAIALAATTQAQAACAEYTTISQSGETVYHNTCGVDSTSLMAAYGQAAGLDIQVDGLSQTPYTKDNRDVNQIPDFPMYYPVGG